jgi:hypothetical protein
MRFLLAAAFLQENKNYKELTSYEVSSALKKAGHPVNHPSATISSLISRKPHLLVQLGSFGTSKQSRRKFRVTEAGLKIARGFVN